MNANEYVTSLSGRYGSLVDSMVVATNFGRFVRVGGGGGSNDYFYEGDNNHHKIAAVFGRSGRLIDAIGAVYVSS